MSTLLQVDGGTVIEIRAASMTAPGLKWFVQIGGPKVRQFYIRLGFILFLLTMTSGVSVLSAQTPTAAVIDTIQIPGAGIVGLSVGSDGELAVYDWTPAASNCLMRFYVASMVADEPVVTEMPETEIMVGDAPGFIGWMVRANGLLYALSENSRTTNHLRKWHQMWVYVFSGRNRVGAIGYNDTATVAGDEPSAAPEDFWYRVNGFTIKPADVEGDHNARLIIDDTVKGNFDVLELNSLGTGLQSQVRYSYQGRNETDCDWPDLDPDLTWYYCHAPANGGNGLAQEWTFDTAPSDPTLDSVDHLFLLDPGYSKSNLRRFEISHLGGLSFSAVELAGIDLTLADPDLIYGVQGLHEAPTADRIWMPSSTQTFANGHVAVVDTRQLTTQSIDPVFSDEGVLMVDPADNNHVIIPVSDSFASPATLILRELQNGVVINSVTALTNYDCLTLNAAAYDRTFGLVYLAIDDTIFVVEATAPTLEIFSDGFEDGNTSNWSGASP